MRAAALVGPGRIEVIDTSEPGPIGSEEVLLEVLLVGICGSDVHYFETGRIGDAQVSYPFILGHEMAGAVLQVGGRVQGLKVGDLVAVDPAMSCGRCDQCRSGRFHTCRNLRFLGCPGQAQGCLCQYVAMPARCCHLVPEGLTLEQAVLVEPLAIAVYACKRSAIGKGRDVVILGAGPIGLCCLQVARAFGARQVLVSDPISQRAAAASAHGASWAGSPVDLDQARAELMPLGADVVLEAAGQQEAIDQGLGMLKPGGVLAVIGIPRSPTVSMDIHLARRQEVTWLNIRRQNECTAEAIRMIDASQVQVGPLVTHRFDLGQAQVAFDLLCAYRDGVIKAMVRV